MNQPKVSIIMPSLNVHDYIQECIESVINQSLREIEIICVDAGSTDGTLEIINEYVKKDPRVKLIISDRKSYGYQMNIGFDACTGKYLGIVETDDFVPSNMYKELFDIAENNALDFVKADFYRFKVNEDGSLDKDYNALSRSAQYYNRVLKPGEEPEVFKFIMNTWSGIYRMDFLREWNIRHNETPGASYQDNGFWFQTFCRAQRAYFYNKPFYMNRRDNPNSSVYSKTKVYCMRAEYDYVRSIIDNDLENLQEFIPMCNYFRFCGYYYNTLMRVSEELREEFLQFFSNEFKKLIDKCEIDRKLFSNKEWNDLLQIVYDPAGFKVADGGDDSFVSKRSLSYKGDIENAPDISVIVPVYNVEEYLETCLESLRHQSLRNIEIICVNDGSTDSSYRILERYSLMDERFVVITQQNSGLSAARNTALTMASGKYVCFVDSDDGLAPKALQKIYNTAEKNKSDIVIFGFITDHYPLCGPVPDWLKSKNTKRNVVYHEFKPEALFNEPGAKPFVWRNCYRRSFLREKNLFYLEWCQFGEDTVFQMQSFPMAKNITFIKDKLYYYRCIRADSLMSKHNQNAQMKVCRHMEIVSYLSKVLSEQGTLDKMRAQFVTWAVNFILNELCITDDIEFSDVVADIITLVNKLTFNDYEKWMGTGNQQRMMNLKNMISAEKDNIEENKIISFFSNEKIINPQISIIIPVHNMESEIKKCLGSLLNQKFQNIEIICINDASTDGTLDVLKAIAEKDKRLIIINYEENQTANQARKDGVMMAQGEYVLFCDADDTYCSNALEILFKEMQRNPVDILHFGTNVINCGGAEADKVWLDNNLMPYYGTLCGKDILEGCFLKNLFGYSLWNKMYSAKLAKRAFSHVEDGKFPRGQDLYAFVLLAYYAESYRGLVGYHAYNYHLGLGMDGKISISIGEFERFCSFSKVIDALERFLKKENVFDAYYDIWSNIQNRMLGDCMNKWHSKVSIEDKGKGVDLLLKSWPSWMVSESIARKYWGQYSEMTQILKNSSLNNVIPSSVKVIGMYYHNLLGGGVEKVIQELTPLFIRMGYKIVLLTDIQGPEDYWALPSGTVRYAIPNVDINQPQYYYRRVRRINEIISNEKIDVMIYHAWNTTMLLWDMMSIKAAGVSCLVHCHSIFTYRLLSASDYFSDKPKVFGLADGIVCLSETDACFWKKFNSRVFQVLNPCTMDINNVEPSTLELKNILWVGRLSPEKHPEEALYILRKVVKQIPNIKLKIVGTTSDEKMMTKLYDKVKDLEISDNVEFCGFHENMAPFYSEAFVLLSTSECEGYSLCLLEGKAFGLPIVLYELPYLEISKGNRGMLPVRYADSTSAAEKIIELYNNEEYLRNLAVDSRAHALELADYDYETIWKNIFSSMMVSRPKVNVSDVEMMMWNTLLEHYRFGIRNTNYKPKYAVESKVYSNVFSYIFSKIIGFFKCYNDHGFLHTIKRVKWHIDNGVSLIPKGISSLKTKGVQETISCVKKKLGIIGRK